jgi:hypothetical protein
MKINEVITEKERVDELAPLIPLAVTAARTALPYALRYGKKAWDAGKKLLPVMKKAKDVRYHKYTSEEEALIKAGIATHTKKEAKKLAQTDEYPVEKFRAKPNMLVKIFYWPNKEIGKPYTVYH